MNKHEIEEGIFKIIMKLATFMILLILLIILWDILKKGFPYLSWEMVSQTPKGGFYLGKGGGILNAIIGSLYIAGGAAFLSIFLSLPIAMYLNVYRKQKSKFASFLRLCLDVLWGIPSIVYGAFGFTLMLIFGLQSSLLTGILTVTIMVLPIMIRAMDEVLMTVPIGLMEASYSLGATQWETSFRVVTKQALPGILTAVLISFGRGIGDAAAVLFTAGFTDHIPTSLNDAAATLPLSIFFQLSTPIQAVQGRAYAAALILTIVILIISVASRLLTRKYTKHKV